MAQYLGDKDRPTEKVRCPVHGFIRYSKNERAIIDSPAFRRLRSIKQLALTYYVYPGAMHSRLEHSLGVMEMATRAFDVLVMKQHEKVEAELANVPELQKDTLARGRQAIRLLALLHDIGHPAFSHAAESVLPMSNHEDISIYVIENVLREQIDGLFFDGLASLLCRLLKKQPEVTFLRQFVVGDIDMDRADYLRRDSLHCGVDYGHFDMHRMIEALVVIENPETKQAQIGLERGGEHVFEALILARYQMNTQVYYHRLRRIYDQYLTQYMSMWAPNHYVSPETVLEYDDMDLLVEMRKDMKADNERTELAKRIVNREHHKRVFESGDSTDVLAMRKAKSIFHTLQQDFPGTDFVIDIAEGSIHKQIVPDDHREDADVDPVYLAERNGSNPTMISLGSGILRTIPKRFRNVRIYADDRGSGKITRIKESALKAWKA